MKLLKVLVKVVLIILIVCVLYISASLVYKLKILPQQGKISRVVENTSWIQDNVKIYFMQNISPGSLNTYSININGLNKNMIGQGRKWPQDVMVNNWDPRGGIVLSNGDYLYDDKGSLWLVKEGAPQLLVEYEGIYDSKMASGIKLQGVSKDEKYVLFSFKDGLYIFDLISRKSGFLIKGKEGAFSNI